jgi:NADH-quinone oxidoreductase subunit G
MPLKNGAYDAVVIAENDLYRRLPAGVVDAALQAAKHIIVLDHQLTPTSRKSAYRVIGSQFCRR